MSRPPPEPRHLDPESLDDRAAIDARVVRSDGAILPILAELEEVGGLRVRVEDPVLADARACVLLVLRDAIAVTALDADDLDRQIGRSVGVSQSSLASNGGSRSGASNSSTQMSGSNLTCRST